VYVNPLSLIFFVSPLPRRRPSFFTAVRESCAAVELDVR
jgi:hypothetical protein